VTALLALAFWASLTETKAGTIRLTGQLICGECGRGEGLENKYFVVAIERWNGSTQEEISFCEESPGFPFGNGLFTSGSNGYFDIYCTDSTVENPTHVYIAPTGQTGPYYWWSPTWRRFGYPSFTMQIGNIDFTGYQV
jgi:hypothetical protein